MTNKEVLKRPFKKSITFILGSWSVIVIKPPVGVNELDVLVNTAFST